MKPLIILALLLVSAFPAFTQYTIKGKIEYERKMNVHRRIDDMDEHQKQWAEKVRSQIPKFSISYFDLYFNTTESIYKPGREPDTKAPFTWYSEMPAAENVVHTNFATGNIIASKQVFEEKFLVHDSVQRIQWRITDEIRTIADYKCRKAVGKICDSVYVVAFYTDDIMVNGGPEMFNGLPGMILEIAIPRLYTTWIATKVETELPSTADFKTPEKGKKVSPLTLSATLKESVKRWGKDADSYIWWVML